MAAAAQSPALLLVTACLNVPVLIVALRLAFAGWVELGEAFAYFLSPFGLQVRSGGDWSEHQWDSLKILLVVLVMIGLVFAEDGFTVRHFPGAVGWANYFMQSRLAPASG